MKIINFARQIFKEEKDNQEKDKGGKIHYYLLHMLAGFFAIEAEDFKYEETTKFLKKRSKSKVLKKFD